jgi:hypothetical protein
VLERPDSAIACNLHFIASLARAQRWAPSWRSPSRVRVGHFARPDARAAARRPPHHVVDRTDDPARLWQKSLSFVVPPN